MEDNFETRLMLIFVHFSVILIAYKNKVKKKFPQEIYDSIFLNIELHLRELGYGDIAVNKKMKVFNKIFYDILLKINIEKNNFKINKLIIKKYLKQKTQNNDPNNELTIDYINNFYNYCFELKDDIMLKGNINFKYI